MIETYSSELRIFGESIQLTWQSIPLVGSNCFNYQCHHNQFYLNLPGIARFLALPEKNAIIIEKMDPQLDTLMLNTWLFGTVMAYVLQYRDYLVLHGSAVLIHDQAVIFSGQSGAGKSTLASAFVQKGYPLITDDLIVIKRNQHNQYCIIPGPATLKLCQDAMQHFAYDLNDARRTNLNINKYAVPVARTFDITMIPITAFYELNMNQYAQTFSDQKLNATQSLKTLMQNAYRYFMLKPLGKLPSFFHDCHELSQKITVIKITRTTSFDELAQIVHYIESSQGGTI